MDETRRTIYDLCKQEEAAFKLPVPINENWEWGMYKHIVDTITYKYGQLTQKNDGNKPIKNIILPKLRLRYRTEGFDAKDIELFVDDKDEYWKSLIVKKYHEKYVIDNKIDEFIDKASETDIDFGGVLVKDAGESAPVVVPWESIAFCDQTNVLDGTLGIKTNYSPDKLMEKKALGWGNFGTTLEDVVRMSHNSKLGTQTLGIKAKTPGKYIEVYEIHGMFPKSWLNPDEDYEEDDDVTYTRQVHIICFYQTDDNSKKGICLYRGKLAESPFLFRADEIFGRGLGYGGVEELTEAQVWTTYDQIRIKGFLDAASKILLKTTDATLAGRHPTGLKDLDNLSIVDIAPNADISQINTQPMNMAMFENNLAKWEEHATVTSGATEAVMGETPSSGVPLGIQQIAVAQSLGLHEHRMGKFAKFIEEVERAIILPRIAEEITKGSTFLSELNLDELKMVSKNIIICQWNDYAKEKILNGGTFDDGEQEAFMAKAQKEFSDKGNKHFIEIVKDEFSKAKLNIRINIKGKQKDMVRATERLTNIFRFASANPDGFIRTLQIPGMAKSFNEMLEFSGMTPADFTGIENMPTTQPTPQAPQPAQLPVTNNQ